MFESESTCWMNGRPNARASGRDEETSGITSARAVGATVGRDQPSNIEAKSLAISDG